jgi:RHS repeat-associated protein
MTDSAGTTSLFASSGALLSVTNINGLSSTYNHNTAGQLTSITLPNGSENFTYNSQGTVSAATAPNGRSTTYTYDASGHYLASITANGQTTAYSWVGGTDLSSENNIAAITDPDGSSLKYSYDSQGRPTGVTTGTGTPVSTTTYNQDGSVTVTPSTGGPTTFWQDGSGQVAKLTGPTGQHISLAYDAAGNPTSSIINGAVTTDTLNTAGQTTSITDPLGNTTQLAYQTGSPNLTSATDPLGHPTTYSYDPAGDVTNQTFPDGTSASATYNQVGNPTTFTDRSGAISSYQYNPQGLLSGITEPGPSQLTYTYDTSGNMTSAAGPTGTTNFTYDADNQLTETAYPNGLSVALTYNVAGQRTSETSSDGAVTSYTYNPSGELASVSNGSPATTTTYTYNSVGSITTITNGNGTTTAYTYDANGLVSSVVTAGPGAAPIDSVTYSRDSDGRIITALSPPLAPNAGLTSYAYDNGGNLTSVSLPGGRTISYAYDAAGNRSSVADSANGTSSYLTNTDGAYTQAGATAYTYNTLGAIATSVTAGVTTTYSYDTAGDLASVTSPGHSTTYTYDALGTPLSQTIDGVTTNLLTDPTTNNLLTATGPTAAQSADYTYGNGLVSQTSATATAWYAFDASGNTSALTDQAGTVTDTYSYLPFGQSLSSTGSTPNPFGFAGQYGLRSDGSSLLAAGVRNYDPSTGHFTSPDTAAAPATSDYAYGNNDPVDYVDPTGSSGTPTGLSYGLQLSNDVSSAVFGGAFNMGHDMSTNAYKNNSAADNAFNTSKYVPDLVGTTGGNALAAYNALSGVPKPPIGSIANGLGNVATAATGLSEGISATQGLYQAYQGFKNLNQPGGVQNVADGLGQVVLHSGNAFLKTLWSEVPGSAILIDGTEAAVNRGSQYLMDQFFDWYYDPADEVGVPPHLSHLPPGYKSQTKTPGDPNDMVGPAGYGTAGYVARSSVLPYEIDFTNMPTASLSAEDVTVTETLDPNVAESTFALGEVGFAGHTDTPPPGVQNWSTVINDVAVSGLNVKVTASLNTSTRVVTWTFASIDPATGDTPANPADGFLPPDITSPQGEAFVDYTVSPSSSDTSGTVISAAASIVFDTNAAMVTAPATNTIDAGPPSVTVAPLPATESGPFNVTWSGADDLGGSGVAYTDVYVSDNGASPTLLVSNSTANSVLFTGQTGHSYSFFAVGVDNVGNMQGGGIAAQAGTTVVAPTTVTTPTFDGKGYWEVASDGGVFAFGSAKFYGSMGGTQLNSPIVGMSAAPDDAGYWEVASDGGVFAFGSAKFYGSMGGSHLNKPVVGMTAAPDGKGYWLVASDGGVFAFGSARFYGSMGGTHLNQPIVGMTAAPDGKGYWLVASDGGVFAFGSAKFYGSMGGTHLNAPIVGMTAAPDGAGYWLVASDGGVFAFGSARFYGSMGGTHLNKPVVGMAAAPDGAGYWLVASDGGVFAFGSARFYGSMGGTHLNKPVVGMINH